MPVIEEWKELAMSLRTVIDEVEILLEGAWTATELEEIVEGEVRRGREVRNDDDDGGGVGGGVGVGVGTYC